MVQYHKRTKTKHSGSGGKRRGASDKRLCHYGGFFAKPKLLDVEEKKEARKAFRTIGGNKKVAADLVRFANVSSGQSVKKVRVLNVLESPANRHFARENLLTKGTFIETELGKARITSRPGQDGLVNAVLVEERKTEEKKPAEERKPAEEKKPVTEKKPEAEKPVAEEMLKEEKKESEEVKAKKKEE